MAWCHQATSHYLSQWWSSSMSPYGVTRLQWVKNPVNIPELDRNHVNAGSIWTGIMLTLATSAWFGASFGTFTEYKSCIYWTAIINSRHISLIWKQEISVGIYWWPGSTRPQALSSRNIDPSLPTLFSTARDELTVKPVYAANLIPSYKQHVHTEQNQREIKTASI